MENVLAFIIGFVLIVGAAAICIKWPDQFIVVAVVIGIIVAVGFGSYILGAFILQYGFHINAGLHFGKS